jgi:hypothetical protein
VQFNDVDLDHGSGMQPGGLYHQRDSKPCPHIQGKDEVATDGPLHPRTCFLKPSQHEIVADKTDGRAVFRAISQLIHQPFGSECVSGAHQQPA